MHRSLLAGFPMALVLAVGPLPGQEEDAASLRARRAAALAPIAGVLEVAGLRKPVEVLRDTWGVPHIIYINVSFPEETAQFLREG